MSAAEMTQPTGDAAPAVTPQTAKPTAAGVAGFPELGAKPAAGGTPSANAPQSAPWFDALSADDKAFLTSKGWDKPDKGPGDVVKSYRNLERLRGVSADKLMKVPDWSNAEEVAEFRSRIGVPEAADKYDPVDVKTPTGELDQGMIAALSHRAGLTQAQHAELMAGTGELLTQLFTREAEDISRRNAAELVDLKKEWGAKFDEYNTAVDAAVAQLGLDAEFIDALKIAGGEAKARRVLAQIGLRLAEHKRPSDQGQPYGMMTPDVAKARIQQLQTDRTFFDKLSQGNVEARREWEELQRVAFGE